jgi:16S rRNA (cytidine1402-2'-O)-methyltransferase
MQQHKRESEQKGGLFIVATPIGNLQDMTFRAIEVLTQVSVVLCEDTRCANKLLSHYNIETKTLTYNDHSTKSDRERIITRLESGECIALISDAGTPLVSDPGFKLVAACKSQGIKVVPIPGACSVIAALSASGLPTDRFMFAGFLPSATGKLDAALMEFAGFAGTVVLFESPRRVYGLIERVLKMLGNREVVIGREITKKFEEFIRLDCEHFLKTYEGHEFLGEVVVMIAPPASGQESSDAMHQAQELLRALLGQGVSTKDAVNMVASKTQISKKHLYAEALKLHTE